MVKELYCKLPTDLNYENKLETADEIQIILQQIKMVLGTKPGDILGSPEFGIDLDRVLFSYNNEPDQIRYMINAAIGCYIKFDPKKYSVGCEVNFGKNEGDTFEYALIDIIINQKKCLGVIVNQE